MPNVGVEDHDRAGADGQQHLRVEMIRPSDPAILSDLSAQMAVGFRNDLHRSPVGGHGLGKIPDADLAVAVVAVRWQERVVDIVDVQLRSDPCGIGVTGPVVRVAEMDVPGFEHPLGEVDEIPVDDELVEQHIGVGEAFLQKGVFRRVIFDQLPRGEGPADCGGDGGPLLLRIEVFDKDEALINEGLEMCVGKFHDRS